MVGCKIFYFVMCFRLWEQEFLSCFCSFRGGYPQNWRNSVQLNAIATDVFVNIPELQSFSTWFIPVSFRIYSTYAQPKCPGCECHPSVGGFTSWTDSSHWGRLARHWQEVVPRAGDIVDQSVQRYFQCVYSYLGVMCPNWCFFRIWDVL